MSDGIGPFQPATSCALRALAERQGWSEADILTLLGEDR